MKIFCKKCEKITKHKTVSRGEKCLKCFSLNIEYLKELEEKDKKFC